MYLEHAKVKAGGMPFETYIEPLVYCPDTDRGSCAAMSYPDDPTFDDCVHTDSSSLPDPDGEEAQTECGKLWVPREGSEGSGHADKESAVGSIDCDCGPWKVVSIALIIILCLLMLGTAFMFFRNRKKKSAVAAP